MRHSLAICLLWAASILPVFSSAQQTPPTDSLSLDQYIQALKESLARAQKLQQEPQTAAELRNALPSAWRVQVGEKNFEIPTESLRRDLGAWQSKPDDAVLQRIVQHLETLRSEAEGYGKPGLDSSNHRVQLNDILARREFHNVHGPTWMDRLKQRFTEWLIKILGRAITSSAIPTISNILVYGLIAIALLVLAYWMYRSVRESARLESIMPVAVPVSAKEWPIWLAEARAAAARGEWRQAVHLSYWGGISFLEAQGSWRPDAARTPREYLRLLPTTSTHQPALRSLTQKLERVWYGMQAADADSFQQTLAELEKLGCPCN
ncbi:MAG: DUF4129 domain-containing protein [Terriglobales bacterium]